MSKTRQAWRCLAAATLPRRHRERHGGPRITRRRALAGDQRRRCVL